jgi:hypothetical protein
MTSDTIGQDLDANRRHDRRYGWHISAPTVYTNLSRNPEYQPVHPDFPDITEDQLWAWHRAAQAT